MEKAIPLRFYSKTLLITHFCGYFFTDYWFLGHFFLISDFGA